MVRTRRLNIDEAFAPLGDIVLAFAAVGCLASFAVVALVAVLMWGICEALEWLQKQRFLGGITFGVMVAVVLIHLIGCSSPPTPTPAHESGDPSVWRPTKPAVYPLPR